MALGSISLLYLACCWGLGSFEDSLICLVLIAGPGWELSWGYWLEHLHVAFWCCFLACLQHRVWFQEWVSLSRRLSRSCTAYYDLTSAAVWVSFARITGPPRFKGKVHILHFLMEERWCHIVRKVYGVGYINTAIFGKFVLLQGTSNLLERWPQKSCRCG